MARKKTKRILSMVLAICVMAAGVPTAAFAAEGGNSEPEMLAHYDFRELSGNVTDGTVIKDVSGSNHDAAAKGDRLTAEDSALVFPGGKYGSGAGYVELPRGMFDGQETLTVSMWMQNKTGAGNYAAFYFGTEANSTNKEMPTRYFLLNPMNPKGVMKSVMTNSFNTSAPYTTEVGPGSTGSPTDGPVSSADWALYSVVITPDDITGYLNGVKYKTYPLNVTVSDFGSDLVSYIGKSPYKDIFYAGRVKDLRIYAEALSDQDIAELYYGGTSAGEL
ncbi:LamG-like jellyroll fold domain-containing protein, partial [Robinsoniella sp.]